MFIKFNSTDNNTTKNFDTNFDYTLNLIDCVDNKSTNKDYIDDILTKMKSIFPWATEDNTKNYMYLNITPEALNLEWNKAATNLCNCAYFNSKPSYDFKFYGVPVKIHGNYIQVGSKIIPKFTKSSFFNNFSKKDRITLYEISITINALELAA